MSTSDSIPLLRATELRCEYRGEPLGIDVQRPRLTWLPESDDPLTRNQRQTAYQIMVASSPASLAADRADLWDTGKVDSPETAHIEYAGKPLESSVECWWKVRIWNGGGQSGEWSEPARWSMGLLDPAEWRAKWIGYDAPPEPPSAPADADLVDLDGCKWIWTPAACDRDNSDGPRYFRKVIELPAGGTVARAVLMIASRRRFQFYLNGRSIGCGLEFSQWARAFDVANHLGPGKNILAIEAGIVSSADRGLIGRLVVQLNDGARVEVPLDSSCRCASQLQEGWALAEFDDREWSVPAEICAFGAEPWGTPQKLRLTLPPASYLRKSVEIPHPIKRAFLYASALGVYELHLNGTRVGEDYLSPGWTDYRKRVHYYCYEVTSQLRQGRNALGAILADGWYAGFLSFQGRRGYYGERPRLLVQLHIEYVDGSKLIVTTDQTWKAAHGPILEADLLMGCTYDARREMPLWDTADFEDAKWDPATVDAQLRPTLQAHPGTPVVKTEEIPAQSLSEPDPKVYDFDLGQNIVGFSRLRVRADAGTRIVIRYAEALNPDGSVYTTSLRAARAMDTYVCKGSGEEVWEPKFTFHGFRYVEVRGLPRRPTLNAVTGIVIHSALERSGWFECSNPLINQLFNNIIWGQKGNYLEAPTDCPQRDERLGWTGDAQVFLSTGAYNFDVAPFFNKWLIDLIDDAQLPNGAFASVAPDVLDGANAGSTGWADAGIICPYLIYRFYGDRRIIDRHFDAMARYVDYVQSQSKNCIKDAGPYGDWLHLGGGAHNDVIGTAYFAYVSRLMAEMAAAIGREAESRRYADLADRVRQAFVSSFIGADGTIKQSSQTGYALAFTMNLIPEAATVPASQRLVEEIRKKDWHLATGFLGTPRLLPALTRAGRTDVAYRLLLTETFPGWLFQVKQGATTVWERWDGWVPGRGFQDPGMNSLNHYAFGAVGEWLYRTVVGIDSDGPGFSRITIKPHPGGGLSHANAAYKSIRGKIESGWEIDDRTVKMRVTIPANSTATVHIPEIDPQTVCESDRPIDQVDSVHQVSAQIDSLTCRVGSGTYVFTGRRLVRRGRA